MTNLNPTPSKSPVLSHPNELSTDRQVQYLCALAYSNCGMEEDEILTLLVRFAAMNRQQASDLIATWKELPVNRKTPWAWKFQNWTRAHGLTAPDLSPAGIAAMQAASPPTAPAAAPAPPRVIPPPYVQPRPAPAPTPAPVGATPYPAAPRPPKFPYPEAGYYAVEVPIDGKMTMRFYRVTQKRGSTYKNFRRMSSDTPVTVNLMEQYLACTIINAAPRLAQETYGRLIGRCGCCGRTLTDAQSRADGIGPECIKRFQ